MRILLVETDNSCSNRRRQLLEKNGYGVDLMSDGAAVDYAQAGDYGLVVLSERLAGRGTVRQLREGGVTAPVLLLAAEDTPGSRASGLEDGADDCVGPDPERVPRTAGLYTLLRRPDAPAGAAVPVPGWRKRVPGQQGIFADGVPDGGPGPGLLPPAAL